MCCCASRVCAHDPAAAPAGARPGARSLPGVHSTPSRVLSCGIQQSQHGHTHIRTDRLHTCCQIRHATTRKTNVTKKDATGPSRAKAARRSGARSNTHARRRDVHVSCQPSRTSCRLRMRPAKMRSRGHSSARAASRRSAPIGSSQLGRGGPGGAATRCASFGSASAPRPDSRRPCRTRGACNKSARRGPPRPAASAVRWFPWRWMD